MHLVFDIFQGIGISASVGIRPFLPALVAGGLAAGDVEINFDHTNYSFLESTPFLLGVAIAAIVLALLERRLGRETLDRQPFIVVLGGLGAAFGALFFAGSLAHGHYAAWPGWIGGVVCALIALVATVPLLVRVRARLDPEAAGAVPLYAEGTGVLLAGLSIVAPPVGPIALALLLWLLIASRRRGDQKYAGLRILR